MKVLRTVRYLLYVALYISASGMRAAEVQTIPFDVIQASLNLDAVEPLSHKSFRTLIREKGLPFTIIVGWEVPRGEMVKVYKGVPFGLVVGSHGDTLAPYFFAKTEWVNFSRRDPQGFKGLESGLLKNGPIVSYQITDLGSPARQIGGTPLIVGVNVPHLAGSSQQAVAAPAAVSVNSIKFPDLLIEGDPVELDLGEDEPLTQQTFSELIAEQTPYTIAVIKSNVFIKRENRWTDVYHFFDAEQLDAALARKMENPLTNLPISPEDILRYKILNLTTPPKKVSGTAVSTGELPPVARHAGEARSVGEVELHPAASPVGALPVIEAAMPPAARPAAAEGRQRRVPLISIEKPFSHTQFYHPSAATDINLVRPGESIASGPAIEKAALSERAEVSVGLVDSDLLNSAYHSVTDQLPAIEIRREINPEDYRMDFAAFRITLNTAVQFDRSYVDELLKSALSFVVPKVLEYKPEFNFQYFGIVSGYLVAVFECKYLDFFVERIGELFRESAGVQSLIQSNVIRSIEWFCPEPIVRIAKIKGTAPAGIGVFVEESLPPFKMDSSRISVRLR